MRQKKNLCYLRDFAESQLGIELLQGLSRKGRPKDFLHEVSSIISRILEKKMRRMNSSTLSFVAELGLGLHGIRRKEDGLVQVTPMSALGYELSNKISGREMLVTVAAWTVICFVYDLLNQGVYAKSKG